MNSYVPVVQAGGTFESGLRNRVPLDFAYQIRTGIGSQPGAGEARDAIRQLRALAVEYVVVHGVESAEYYRDFKRPEKFEGYLERAAVFGPDIVYRVPFRSMAAAVDPLQELPQYDDWRFIENFARALEDPSRAVPKVEWQGPSTVRVSGIPAGGAASLAVSWDPGWVVDGAGSIAPNQLGWMTLSGAETVRLRYAGTNEQKTFAALSIFVWAASLYRLWRERR
jgi:hypothetical protein